MEANTIYNINISMVDTRKRYAGLVACVLAKTSAHVADVGIVY